MNRKIATDVFFISELQVLSSHFLDFNIVKFVPVLWLGVSDMCYVMTAISTGSTMYQNCCQIIQTCSTWKWNFRYITNENICRITICETFCGPRSTAYFRAASVLENNREHSSVLIWASWLSITSRQTRLILSGGFKNQCKHFKLGALVWFQKSSDKTRLK